jgi:hypothetical protein
VKTRSITDCTGLLVAIILPLLACGSADELVPNDPLDLYSDPPLLGVPLGPDLEGGTFTCPITALPPGITKDDLEVWLKDHAHLARTQEEFDELCAKLKKGVDDAILHSKHGDSYAMDAAAEFVIVKAKSAAVTSISEVPELDGGTAAILGTTTDTIEAEFACGSSGTRTVLCASSEPPPAGDWLVVSAVMKADIPLDDPSLYLQYAFVFDADGDAANDYQAPAEYPYDFFDGTDRWYQVNVDPQNGAVFSVKDATNGNVQPATSDARFVIEGDTMLALIPASEMVVCPFHRATAFAHHGDYGLNAPWFWAGDTEPTVAQGLEAVCDAL